MLDLCIDSCAPYGDCEDALVALSDSTPDESSNDPSSSDTFFTCGYYKDTVLAGVCPQCVDPTCAPTRLFSEGPSAALGRSAGGTTTTLALAGGFTSATAAVLLGAAVLRKRFGVRAPGDEPLTAGADSEEASDAIGGAQ